MRILLRHILVCTFLFSLLGTSKGVGINKVSATKREHIVLTSNSLRKGIRLKNDVIYEIESNVDLEGKTIVFPSGCLLLFKGGCIKNGEIVGNLADIDCNGHTKSIFKNISILGTWKCSQIIISWIDYHNDGMIQSILRLQNPDVFQEIVFPEDSIEWMPTAKTSYLADIKSNCRVIINGMIKTRSNNLFSNEVFYVNNQQNVIIEGGEIIGDCDSHIPVKGNTSEGCHGIRIRGGHNITIKNVILRSHNGDGIFVRGISYSTQSKKMKMRLQTCLLRNVH